MNMLYLIISILGLVFASVMCVLNFANQDFIFVIAWGSVFLINLVNYAVAQISIELRRVGK